MATINVLTAAQLPDGTFGVTFGAGADDIPSLNAILAQHYTGDEIGGPSEAGWHRIAEAMTCWRKAFYSQVMNIEPIKSSPGRDIGTLCHACLARHYKTGGQDTFGPLEIVEPYYPQYAAMARKLLNALQLRYGYEESQTWDVRAVEAAHGFEMRGTIPVGSGKRIRTHGKLTCRYDLLVAQREPGAAPRAFGVPAPTGVSIVDHKFVASMSRAYITGFSMDGQVLANALVYVRSGLEQIYGPLKSFIVNVVPKTKDPQPDRIEIVITHRDLVRFEEVIRPWALELAWRHQQSYRTRVARWPMNLASCKPGPWTCDYFDLCESHGDAINLYRKKAPR